MKKYLFSAVITLIIAFLTVGLTWYLVSNQAEKSTKNQVAQLFSKKYNRPANTVVIGVGSDSGTFAKGTVRYTDEFGGGVWFAAKTTNGWELAHDGNGIVPCDAVNKYNFPKDMVTHCIDTSNGNKLITR